MNSFIVASVPVSTGYMEICCVCVLTQGTVVQGKIESAIKMCCLLDSCLLTQTKNQNIQITGRTVCTVPVVTECMVP